MSLKIAILGTKGIPNRYGGFEQFAEYLSAGLAQKGHELTVYAPHYHPFQGKEIKKVKIKHFYCPERYFGGAAHYIYDHLCLKDAIKSKFDIIYEAGYGSCAFALRYFKKRMKTPVVITNMDGMEWKRKKFNPMVQYVTRQAEKIAVRYSDFLIADNLGVKRYFEEEYGVIPVFLPYGAETIDRFDAAILKNYSLKPKGYLLIIARLEPENNLETMIRGYIDSNSPFSLVIIGGLATKHAKKLLALANQNPKIIFLGGIYDPDAVNNLRHFSKAYLHGHSVGGTNPSLLEAMACESFIIAHDNEFNRSVLEDNALFFSDESNIKNILTNLEDNLHRNEKTFRENNLELIRTKYDWDFIIDCHDKFFKSVLSRAVVNVPTQS
jgi:glycosyltransferase involved in cell wall biosynthesis